MYFYLFSAIYWLHAGCLNTHTHTHSVTVCVKNHSTCLKRPPPDLMQKPGLNWDSVRLSSFTAQDLHKTDISLALAHYNGLV